MKFYNIQINGSKDNMFHKNLILWYTKFSCMIKFLELRKFVISLEEIMYTVARKGKKTSERMISYVTGPHHSSSG